MQPGSLLEMGRPDLPMTAFSSFALKSQGRASADTGRPVGSQAKKEFILTSNQTSNWTLPIKNELAERVKLSYSVPPYPVRGADTRGRGLNASGPLYTPLAGCGAQHWGVQPIAMEATLSFSAEHVRKAMQVLLRALPS